MPSDVVNVSFCPAARATLELEILAATLLELGKGVGSILSARAVAMRDQQLRNAAVHDLYDCGLCTLVVPRREIRTD